MKNKSLVPIECWQSQTGATIYFVRRPEVPMVNIDILFRAGSCRDEKKYGLSHLTNIMLNQGTRNLNADEIADKFADVGAYLSLDSGKDGGYIGLKCLTDKKYFNPAFKLFLDILHSVDFPKTALQRRQKQTISALQMQEQLPAHIAQTAFCSALYNQHPYSHNMEGTSESVMALSQADVKHFYQQYYVLKNAIITIIGDVSFKEAENIVNKIAENLPAGKEAAAIIPVPAQKAVGHRHITFPSEQANVYMGHLGIRHHDPDYYALYIGNDILGGSSITSRLFTQIRGEQGLVYGINSSFQFSDAKGPFLINFATKNSSVKKALALIRSILKDYVLRGPTQKEFQLAKQKINNEFPLSLATNSDISHYLVKIGFYKLPLDYIDKYRDNISAVSLEHVKAALKKHIHLDDMVTVVVGP